MQDRTLDCMLNILSFLVVTTVLTLVLLNLLQGFHIRDFNLDYEYLKWLHHKLFLAIILEVVGIAAVVIRSLFKK